MFTSLDCCNLCSMLCVPSTGWETQALKNLKSHIMYYFMYLLYGCLLFPESAMHSHAFVPSHIIFLLVMCSASIWRMPTLPLRSCSHLLPYATLSDFPRQSGSLLYERSDFTLSNVVAFVSMYMAPHSNTHPFSS